MINALPQFWFSVVIRNRFLIMLTELTQLTNQDFKHVHATRIDHNRILSIVHTCFIDFPLRGFSKTMT